MTNIGFCRKSLWRIPKRERCFGIVAGYASCAGQQRGGVKEVRVIYYWVGTAHQIYMLYIYPKAKQENLNPAQLKALRQIIEERE
jgi:hypothetical protein